MILLSLLTTLLLEQRLPLAQHASLLTFLRRYEAFFPHHLNAGEHKHGKIAWLIAVLLPIFVTLLTYHWLTHFHPVLAWAWCVIVLYLNMGFRPCSLYFSRLQTALQTNDLPLARQTLSKWCNKNYASLNTEEVARLGIEHALLSAHRHLFGVIYWFVIFMLLGLGPSGAVLYRLSHFLHQRWHTQADLGAFSGFAQRVYPLIEWLPSRLTAATFAIVGDFENTLYCWRNQASHWSSMEAGIILSSGAGALSVRLGRPITQNGTRHNRPEMGTGDTAAPAFMQSTRGLIWRSLVLQLTLLFMLSISNLVG
jgi:adenosylcobinamide-phosphate synthase